MAWRMDTYSMNTGTTATGAVTGKPIHMASFFTTWASGAASEGRSSTGSDAHSQPASKHPAVHV